LVYDITVEQFGHTFDCAENETILSAALRNRVFLRYGCQHGGCGACKARLVDGDVELTASSYALPPRERDAGTILVCQSYPVEDCVIDVAAMQLGAEEFFRGDGAVARTTVLESVESLTPNIRRVVLRHPDRPMPFVAGQFVNVTVPGHAVARSYSMANGSADTDRIELICTMMPGGLFSRYVDEQARSGDELIVNGPYGLMAIRLSHRDIVMVAGGAGLAPLLAMLTDLADKRSTSRGVTLFFGARSTADLYALAEIAALQDQLPALTFVPVLQAPPPGWTGAVGVVTDALAAHSTVWSSHDAYLCGPPGMVDAARDLLVDRGVRPQNVYADAFVCTGETPAP
jgi:propane monooxygenase reductase subunit